MIKYTAIMLRNPGKRFRMIAMFIMGLRALKRIHDMAYATISTNMVEMTHVKHATMNVLSIHRGNWLTESGTRSAL